MVPEAGRIEADSQQTPSVAILPCWAYIQPTLEVLHERGGSATVQELLDYVAAKMGLSEHQLSLPHEPGKDQSEVAYRMAWARTCLKKAGLIDNSSRGAWSLTQAGQKIERVDGQAIARKICGDLSGRESGAPDSENATAYLLAWNPAHSDRLADHIVSRWRDFWEEARSDAAWLERHRLRDAKRWEVLPQIRALVVKFLQGEITLDAYRETFDRKTRNEWDLFGLKGMSGAMFLNKLAKHLPDQNEVAEKLRRAIDAPASEAEPLSPLTLRD